MSVFSDRARVASLTRSRSQDDPDLITARTNLKAANLAEHIKKVVADAPSLTASQRADLAALLRGGDAL